MPDDKSNELQRSSYDNLIAEDGELFQTHVGGAALIEGIMMRGKYNWAVAVRQPDNSIYTEEHKLPQSYKAPWKKLPLIRGCFALYESMVLSLKAMSIAADHAYDFTEEEPKNKAKHKHKAAVMQDAGAQHPSEASKPASPEKKNYDEGGYGMGAKEVAVSIIAGLVLGVLGFVALPAVLTNLIMGDYALRPIAWNAVDGILRVLIFVLYIWLIGRLHDIRRMFGYHGAEHKCIHCFEHGLELTSENCQKFSTMHVRCGTAFVIMTLIISIFVFTIFPTSMILDSYEVHNKLARLLVVIASRIVLLPVVAGIAYELSVKWAGSRPNHPLVKLILWPGMQMQKLTTNPPDTGQLECAIAAMKLVIACEEEQEKAGNLRPVSFAQSPCDLAHQPACRASVARKASPAVSKASQAS